MVRASRSVCIKVCGHFADVDANNEAEDQETLSTVSTPPASSLNGLKVTET